MEVESVVVRLIGAAGSVSPTVTESVHPLASVTTTEMFPADSPVAVCVCSGRHSTHRCRRGASGRGDCGRTVCAAVTVDVEPAGQGSR